MKLTFEISEGGVAILHKYLTVRQIEYDELMKPGYNLSPLGRYAEKIMLVRQALKITDSNSIEDAPNDLAP